MPGPGGLTAWCAWVALLAGTGCGDSGGEQNQNLNRPPCGEGYERQGPACLPVFDPCPGPAEVPVLGGGCQAVGVTACATGFAPDGQGGCDAVLPIGPCPAGSFEVIGEPDCQPVGDCGAGPWGPLVPEASTRYVDATAEASGADGSAAHPFPTIEEALSGLPDGGQIALAAGEYLVALELDRPVRLAGRCADRVVLRGRTDLGVPQPPIRLRGGASGTVIQGLTLASETTGLDIDGASGVTVQDTQILDTAGVGIQAFGAGLTLLRTVVSGSTIRGILLEGTEALISHSVIRETRVDGSGLRGRGLQAQCDLSGPACGQLALHRSVISGNTEDGILLFSLDATITDSVIRGTRRNPGGGFGRGLETNCEAEAARCGVLRVSGSLVQGSPDSGIVVSGGDAEISGTVIRATPEDGSPPEGSGIMADCGPAAHPCGQVALVDSVVSGGARFGIELLGPATRIEGSVVRDSTALADGTGGYGVFVHCAPGAAACGALEVRRSLLARNTMAALAATGAEARIVGSVIRDTRSGSQGDAAGVLLSGAASGPGSGRLVLQGSLVTGNEGVGVLLYGGESLIDGSVIRDTRPAGHGVGGWAILGDCEQAGLGCSRLEVRGSVLEGNQHAGLEISGAAVRVIDSMIRDTRRLPDGSASHAILSMRSTTFGTPAQLELVHSVIAGNDCVGVLTFDTATRIEASVIRDSRATAGDPCAGVWALSHAGADGSLEVLDSLVTGNARLGIGAIGIPTVITGSRIQETAPNLDGEQGQGIVVDCNTELAVCGQLALERTVVEGNAFTGISIMGMPATLVGVAVLDTEQNTTGRWAGDYGLGIFAGCNVLVDACGALEISDSLVRSSFVDGLSVRGLPGAIRRSRIAGVAPRALDGSFGYGIEIGYALAGQASTFHVVDCQIADADLAGILFDGATGTVSGCEVSGADFTVVWTQPGLAPVLGADNALSGELEDEPSLQTALEPSPAPPPVAPPTP